MRCRVRELPGIVVAKKLWQNSDLKIFYGLTLKWCETPIYKNIWDALWHINKNNPILARKRHCKDAAFIINHDAITCIGSKSKFTKHLALEVEVKETAFEEVEEHLYYLNVSEMGISSAENIESPAPLPILQ